MRTACVLAALVLSSSACIGWGQAAAAAPTTQQAASPGSRMTLKFTDAPTTEVLAEMARQLPFELVYDRKTVAAVRLSLDANDQSFWQVMAKLEPQWPLRVASQPLNGPSLNLTRGDALDFGPLSQQLESVVVNPVSISLRTDTDYGAPAGTIAGTVATVKLAVLIEPSLQPRELNIAITEAIDEHGRPVTLAGPSAARPPAQLPALATVALKPAAGASRLSVLRGAVRYKKVLKWGAIPVPLAQDKKEQKLTVLGRQVGVTASTLAGGAQVVLSIPVINGPHDGSTRSMMEMLVCEDQNGARLSRELPPRPDGAYGNWLYPVTFLSAKNEQVATKIYFETVEQTQDVEVRFELKDIPLSE